MIYFVRSTPDEMKGWSQTSIVTPSPLASAVPETVDDAAAWRDALDSDTPPPAWTLACEMDAPAPPAASTEPIPPETPIARISHRERLRGAAFKRMRLYRALVERMEVVPADWVEPKTYRERGLVVGVAVVNDAEELARAAGLGPVQYRGTLEGLSSLGLVVVGYRWSAVKPHAVYIRMPIDETMRDLTTGYKLDVEEARAEILGAWPKLREARDEVLARPAPAPPEPPAPAPKRRRSAGRRAVGLEVIRLHRLLLREMRPLKRNPPRGVAAIAGVYPGSLLGLAKLAGIAEGRYLDRYRRLIGLGLAFRDLAPSREDGGGQVDVGEGLYVLAPDYFPVETLMNRYRLTVPDFVEWFAEAKAVAADDSPPRSARGAKGEVR